MHKLEIRDILQKTTWLHIQGTKLKNKKHTEHTIDEIKTWFAATDAQNDKICYSIENDIDISFITWDATQEYVAILILQFSQKYVADNLTGSHFPNLKTFSPGTFKCYTAVLILNCPIGFTGTV